MTSDFTSRLRGFLDSSLSPFHAATNAKHRFVEAGFTPLDTLSPWPTNAGSYVFVRDSAVVAWWQPAHMTTPQAKIVGAHTDSPALVVKPHPQRWEPTGWGLINVETYGGLLPNSWLDRDLAAAGRLVTRDGDTHLVATGPLARVPQLAIHLDRDQRCGLSLDPQRHLRPVWTTAEGDDLVAHLADLAGVAATEVSAWDVCLTDSQRAELLGPDQTLLASGRQDNLVSVASGVEALIEAASTRPGHACVFVAFGHEEVGSATTVGAGGPLLEEICERLAEPYGSARGVFRAFIAASACLSVDVAHAVHPNYADRHDSDHAPHAGAGPVLKVNANQRYATDAPGVHLWNRAVEAAGVEAQVFASNNAVPCGSTIGPITATRLGMRTIDAGAPILSMHSIRELSHVADHPAMARVMAAFLADGSGAPRG